MYNKFVYRKRQKRDFVTDLENMSISNDVTETGEPLTNEEEKEILLFFRTCIVDRDLDELKEKMEKTVKLRENIINYISSNISILFYRTNAGELKLIR